MSLNEFTHIYNCKKTGQSIAVEWSKLPDASREYFARKGIGEYFDNYHASVTVKEHGADGCAKLVAPMVDEAFARMMAGDMPGPRGSGRGKVDPEAATAAKYGITVDQLRAMLGGATAAVEKAEAAPAETRHPDKKKKAA